MTRRCPEHSGFLSGRGGLVSPVLAGFGADLLADHVAEKAAEQAPVLAQYLLFLFPGLTCVRVHARKLYRANGRMRGSGAQ